MKIGSSGEDASRPGEQQDVDTASSTSDKIPFRSVITQLTFHGVRQFVEETRPIPLRTIWALTWLVTVGVFLWIYVEVMIEYSHFPFRTTNQALPRSSLPFPAITICNMNSLDVSNVSYATPLREVVASSAFGSRAPNLNFTAEHLQVLNMSAQQVMEDTMPVFEETFKNCQYDDVDIPCNDLFFLTHWGMKRCYTLNQSLLGPANRRTKFNVILNINQAGYIVDRDKSAGARFYIHDPHAIPNVDLHGAVASPGFSTHVAMTLQQFHFLPHPYMAFGDRYCVDTGTTEFTKNHSGNYHSTSCFLTRSVEMASAHCGCAPPYSQSSLPACSVYDMYFCMLVKLSELNRDFLSVSDTIGCPTPCDYVVYHPAVSLSYFPSDEAVKEIQRLGLVKNDTDIRSNYLELLFYYDDVIIYETKHSPEYTAKSLMGTIGGNMGFFLGASVLSICEVLELLVALCRTFCGRVSRAYKRQNISPEDT